MEFEKRRGKVGFSLGVATYPSVSSGGIHFFECKPLILLFRRLLVVGARGLIICQTVRHGNNFRYVSLLGAANSVKEV